MNNEIYVFQSEKPHLAVVFTTFSSSPKKAQLFSNTVKNWAKFIPAIQPILFSTDKNSSLNALAESHGWLVMPCPRVNEYGTPFLKDMYTSAYQIATAPFYAFINGDILFDETFVTTLKHVAAELKYLKSTLLAGRRLDYRPPDEMTFDAWTPEQVRALGKANGTRLSRTDTVDFFVVTRDYPWHAIKDVVIGRPGYDNYLVARSIQLNITTIDVTRTVTALHQMGNYKDRADKKDGRFNKDLIGKFNYHNGLTSRMWFRTVFDYKNSVFVDRAKITDELITVFRERFRS